MYRPRTFQNGNDITKYVEQELQDVAKSISDAPTIPLFNKPPSKPRDGLIVLADGTNWNPGSGNGFYGYRAGAWRFLG